MSIRSETFYRYGQAVTVYREVATGRFTKSYTTVFMWHSLSDACPKCRSLNGHEWREQDLFQNTLWDAVWGDVWNLNADYSLAHPNCRCQLEVRVEVKLEEIAELNDFMEILKQL